MGWGGAPSNYGFLGLDQITVVFLLGPVCAQHGDKQVNEHTGMVLDHREHCGSEF